MRTTGPIVRSWRTGCPVALKIEAIDCVVSVGSSDLTKPTAPLTMGAEKLVPSTSCAVPPRGTSPYIPTPGAETVDS